jgi:hypothetical protein
MKHHKLNNLIENLQNVRMTQEEKSEVLMRSWSAIEKIEAAHEFSSAAGRTAEVGHHGISVATSLKSAWYSYFMEKKFVPALCLAVLLVATGGTSLAAENALPGDLLYPVKVGLNEQVRSLTAITPEAKAKFALEITDRRLKEVALLSSQGRLDAAASATIQDELLKQAGQIKNQVASLVATNNIQAAQEISLNFESSLRAHELILEKISNQGQGQNGAVLADGSSSSVNGKDANASSSDTAGIVAMNAGVNAKFAPAAANPDLAHIAALIATIKTQIATTTAARALLQEAEMKDDAQNQSKIIARLTEIKFKSIEIKRIASTTPISSSARASTSLAYITQSDILVSSASAKVASSSYSDALLDIQKASQYLIDAETLITAEYDADPALKKLIDDALSFSNFSQVGSEAIASSTGSSASTTVSTAASSTLDVNASSTGSVASSTLK